MGSNSLRFGFGSRFNEGYETVCSHLSQKYAIMSYYVSVVLIAYIPSLNTDLLQLRFFCLVSSTSTTGQNRCQTYS